MGYVSFLKISSQMNSDMGMQTLSSEFASWSHASHMKFGEQVRLLIIEINPFTRKKQRWFLCNPVQVQIIFDAFIL